MASVSASFANCFSWEAARDVIKQHGLLNAGIVRQNSKDLGGKIIDIKLCEENGRYVYQLGVLVPGKVKHVIIDARSGVTLGDKESSDHKAMDYAGAGATGDGSAKAFRSFKFDTEAGEYQKK